MGSFYHGRRDRKTFVLRARTKPAQGGAESSEIWPRWVETFAFAWLIPSAINVRSLSPVYPKIEADDMDLGLHVQLVESDGIVT